MEDDKINPVYRVIYESGTYGIFGKENTTGKTVLIKQISCDEKTVLKIAGVLNKNKVSVFHARDVIFDYITAFLYR